MLQVKFMVQFPLYSIISTRTSAKPRKACFNHILISVVLFSFGLLIFPRATSRLHQFPDTRWGKVPRVSGPGPSLAGEGQGPAVPPRPAPAGTDPSPQPHNLPQAVPSEALPAQNPLSEPSSPQATPNSCNDRKLITKQNKAEQSRELSNLW